MRICFLAPANSTHSYRWIKYFADNKHEVSWISLHPSTTSKIDKVDYHEVLSSGILGRTIVTVRRVKEIIKELKPDILHIHSAALYGLVGALSGFRPIAVTVWGSDVLEAKNNPVRRCFVRYILKKAAAITTDADHMVEEMVKIGINREKIKIICFGVDIKRFQCSKGDEEVRSKLGISDGPAIFSIRNFYPVYDIETLLKAVPYVIKEIPAAKFIIAGTGPQEKMLKELAQSLQLSSSVNFAGKIDNSQLPQLLSSIDIYVSTALSDAGISASTAEAMACGVPVVITNSGENAKWIQDGENGFLIPSGSPEILAEKIVLLARNKGLREKFGLLGRNVIVERNNYYREMAKMEEIYLKLVKNNL